jgi:hypothetical protein
VKESAGPQDRTARFRRKSPRVDGIVVAIVRVEHAMTRATVFLLVLILTSLPAASAVCVTWCESQPASTTVLCHQQESPAISSAQTACAALKDSPFLRQDVRIALDAALGVAPVDAAVAPAVGKKHVSVLASGGIARSAPPQRSLVLRL